MVLAALGLLLCCPREAPAGTLEDLAQRAHVVLLGTVAGVDGDAHGAYHTQVVVRVGTVLKGRVDDPTVRVMMLSGPVWSEGRREMLRMWSDADVEFVEGEAVLLFLSRDYETGPNGEEVGFRLQPGRFTITPYGKYLVDDETVRNSRGGSDAHSIAQALEIVRRASAGGGKP